MATELRDAAREKDGTAVKVVYARECTSIFGRKICTPEVRLRAYIHLAPSVASQLSKGAVAAAGAISGTLLTTGVGVAPAAFVALTGALIAIGYETFQNPDGSLDLSITQIAVRLGTVNFPVPLDPATANILLHSL